MRKLLLALALALPVLIPSAQAQGPIVGPGQPILCPFVAQQSPAAAGTLGLVNGVAGKITVICGWHVTSTQSTSSTFQFQYGTQGGPCTTPTNLTPAFSVTSTAPSADHIDYGSMQAPAGTQICVASTGATVALAVMIYYSQY